MPSPEVIGHYRVDRELGRGAMGVVYLAHDTKLGRQVAIKALPAELARDQSRQVKFEREARTLAVINHPNIAAIYGLEELGDERFLVLELAEGDTLADRLMSAPLAADGSGYRMISVADSLKICSQIAAGVAAAHEQGIIHRDLKPANVKIRPDGVVKVLDFGIARGGPTDPTLSTKGTGSQSDQPTMVTEGPPPPLSATTHLGSIVGTPGYMSPEQARGKAVGKASDVWALACMLFECLTGRLAFPGETIADALASTLTMEPEWAALPGNTPARVLSLLRRCLEKDAKKRLADLSEARSEMERALAELTGTGGERLVAGVGGSAGATAAEEDVPEAGNLADHKGIHIPRPNESGSLTRLLLSSKHVTVTGTIGGGKSHLVHAAAREIKDTFRGGVWWVTLHEIPNRVYAESMTAITIGARVRDSVSLRQSLANRIGARSMLLVLDSCQHAPKGCAEMVPDLMEACPNLRIITIAREALGIRRETVFKVSPMESRGQGASTAPGVQLFEARLPRLIPEYQSTPEEWLSISALCEKLQGNPMALELAAGVMTAPPVQDLIDKLEHRLRVMGFSRIESQTSEQVVKLMIDWSYNLISEMERGMLRRLTVFNGGASVRAAAAVSGAGDSFPDAASDDPVGGPLTQQESRITEVLERLVAKGLVQVCSADTAGMAVHVTGSVRYVLPEAVRVFARERLMEFTGAMGVVKRHVQYYGELARQVSPRLEGQNRAGWLAKLTEEYPNLLTAIDTATMSGEQTTGEIIAGVVRQYERAMGLFE